MGMTSRAGRVLALVALALGSACASDRELPPTVAADTTLSTTTSLSTTTAPATTTTTLPPATTTVPPTTTAPPTTTPPVVVVTPACEIHAPYDHPVNANCWMTEDEFIDARLAEISDCLDEIMAVEPCP